MRILKRSIVSKNGEGSVKVGFIIIIFALHFLIVYMVVITIFSFLFASFVMVLIYFSFKRTSRKTCTAYII
jgi:4-hydroxybenzoate polyprenyltransferase